MKGNNNFIQKREVQFIYANIHHPPNVCQYPEQNYKRAGRTPTPIKPGPALVIPACVGAWRLSPTCVEVFCTCAAHQRAGRRQPVQHAARRPRQEDPAKRPQRPQIDAEKRRQREGER